MRHIARPLALVAALAAALTALVASPAGAHSETAEIQVIRFEQSGPLTATIEVGVTYTGDGHLAEDAAVQVSLSGPDGAVVGPLPLTGGGAGSGRYSTEVVFPAPGEWTADVRSTDPTGAATATAGISAEAAGTSAPDGAVDDSPATTEDASQDATTDTDTDAPTDTTEAVLEGEATDGDGETDADRTAGVVVIAVGAAIVIAGAVIAVSRRGRNARTGTDAQG